VVSTPAFRCVMLPGMRAAIRKAAGTALLVALLSAGCSGTPARSPQSTAVSTKSSSPAADGTQPTTPATSRSTTTLTPPSGPVLADGRLDCQSPAVQWLARTLLEGNPTEFKTNDLGPKRECFARTGNRGFDIVACPGPADDGLVDMYNRGNVQCQSWSGTNARISQRCADQIGAGIALAYVVGDANGELVVQWATGRSGPEWRPTEQEDAAVAAATQSLWRGLAAG
jgi:hypothetical protein